MATRTRPVGLVKADWRHLLAPGELLTSPESRLQYRIQSLVGAGGFGQVFLARRLGRSSSVPARVCIKLSTRMDGWVRETYFGQLLEGHPRAIRVYDAFAPRGLLYNHDAEDPDGMVVLGQTRHGEDVEMNRRAAESDLVVYVNINIVSMDGGHKSTATGLAGYTGVKVHHNPATMTRSRSFMDQTS